MNERLKEILKQSGLHPYYNAQEEDIKKFAELIVRECAEKFAAEPDKPFYGRHVSYHILKHFGVAE